MNPSNIYDHHDVTHGGEKMTSPHQGGCTVDSLYYRTYQLDLDSTQSSRHSNILTPIDNAWSLGNSAITKKMQTTVTSPVTLKCVSLHPPPPPSSTTSQMILETGGCETIRICRLDWTVIGGVSMLSGPLHVHVLVLHVLISTVVHVQYLMHVLYKLSIAEYV